MSRVRASLAGVLSCGGKQGKLRIDERTQDPCLMEEGLLMSPMNSLKEKDDMLSSTMSNTSTECPYFSEEPTTAEVTLKKSSPNQSWGMLIERASGLDGYLLVIGTKPGSALDEYNKKAAPGSFLVGKYDMVTKINGQFRSDLMLKELWEAHDSLTIEISHLRRFKQQIIKDNRVLGMSLKHTEGGRAVSVTDVHEGGMTKIAGYDIRAGDLILGVNGQFGRAKEIMNQIKSSSVMDLTIGRMD